MREIIKKISVLKKRKNAVILAHCYQNIEIDEVADYVGDSLYLSQKAKETDADIIVFAGVYFMAQTAKLLSPEKKVLLPRMESGCQMADMIDFEQIREFKSKHPGLPVVCYINSTAEVKSECDICCTSSNAVDVVRSMNVDEVLFLPDTYLGKWVESKLGNVKIHTYPGYCPTHLKILPKDIIRLREEYPNAPVLAHPECHREVTKLADYVGGTAGIMRYAADSKDTTFIIATEKGVVERLRRDYPEKRFILIKDNIVCPNMKRHTLDDIYEALDKEQHEITVDERIARKAVSCINRMLYVPKTP